MHQDDLTVNPTLLIIGMINYTAAIVYELLQVWIWKLKEYRTLASILEHR